MRYYIKIFIACITFCALNIEYTYSENHAQNPEEVYFYSDSLKIQGWFYKAERDTYSPTLLLLHGFPDNNGDLLGLGEALSHEGFNAFAINYTGTHKSEGIWTPETALNSVNAAIEFLKSEHAVQNYLIDTSRIILIGQSFGGGMAVYAAAHDATINYVISIAGGDLAVVGKMIRENPDFRANHEKFLDESMADANLCRGLGGKRTHELFEDKSDSYSLVNCADKLAVKKILLIGGWHDYLISLEDHILPLYRALQSTGAKHTSIHMFDTDHSFSNANEDLVRKIRSWLKDAL